MHHSAQFHCRSSCASWGTCRFLGLSSCHHLFCHRFRSGQYPGQPTTAYRLNMQKTIFYYEHVQKKTINLKELSNFINYQIKITFYSMSNYALIITLNIFPDRTHDGESCPLDQLALGSFKRLQLRSIQFTAVNGAVS